MWVFVQADAQPKSIGRALELVSHHLILDERLLERTPTLRRRSGALEFPDKYF